MKLHFVPPTIRVISHQRDSSLNATDLGVLLGHEYLGISTVEYISGLPSFESSA